MAINLMLKLLFVLMPKSGLIVNVILDFRDCHC
jgi:hypothetical protein